ncbi:hypothetical protein C0992_006313 [Termitomyces sp. T32_za158]|nr:hypothetical protein C0992_006313 [Termitomyces sp. T32_za158]
MAPRRPNAFEVSFPDEFAPHETTSLRQPERRDSNSTSKSTSLKRKGDLPGDVRESKRHQLPPVSNYEDRNGELESADLVIIGEDPFAVEDEEGDPNVKPVRVLSDFAIYDPKHGNEMVPLSSIEEDDGVDRQFEAEGVVSPYYQNDEDEGQEDDDENEDSNNSEAKLVKLSAILRYTFDYTETDG